MYPRSTAAALPLRRASGRSGVNAPGSPRAEFPEVPGSPRAGGPWRERDSADAVSVAPAPVRPVTLPLSALVSPVCKLSSVGDVAEAALACVDSYLAAVARAIAEGMENGLGALDKGLPNGYPGGFGGGGGHPSTFAPSPENPSQRLPFGSPSRAGGAQDPTDGAGRPFIYAPTAVTPFGASSTSRLSLSGLRGTVVGVGGGGGVGGSGGFGVSSRFVSENDPTSPSSSNCGATISASSSARFLSLDSRESSAGGDSHSAAVALESLVRNATLAGVPLGVVAFDIDDTLVRAADGRAIGPMVELCAQLMARRIACHFITGRLDDAGGQMHLSTISQLAQLGMRVGTSYDSLILAPAAARVTMSALSQWKRDQRSAIVIGVRGVTAERVRAANLKASISLLLPQPMLLLSIGDQWGDMLPLGTDFDISSLDAALFASNELPIGSPVRGVAIGVGTAAGATTSLINSPPVTPRSSPSPSAAPPGSPLIARALFGGGSSGRLSAIQQYRFAVVALRDSNAAVRIALAGGGAAGGGGRRMPVGVP